MAAIFSTLLGKGVLTSGAGATFYTAPTLVVVVIRSVTLSSNLAGAGTGIVYLGGGEVLAKLTAAAQYDSEQYDMRVVMAPGDTINALAVAGTIGYTVSGYVLS